MVQNKVARLFFNRPEQTRITPLLIEPHWHPVAGHIQFKGL